MSLINIISPSTFSFSQNQTTYSVACLDTAWLVIVEGFGKRHACCKLTGSVKCVHSAWEMEAIKEEQRDLLHFLVNGAAGTRDNHRRMSAEYSEHWQMCTSGRRYSAKDAHHWKTIRSQDSSIEPLRIMWLRGSTTVYLVSKENLPAFIFKRLVCDQAGDKYQRFQKYLRSTTCACNMKNNYIMNHGRLARWRKWRACDVGEAKEGLENQL